MFTNKTDKLEKYTREIILYYNIPIGDTIVVGFFFFFCAPFKQFAKTF